MNEGNGGYQIIHIYSDGLCITGFSTLLIWFLLVNLNYTH